MGASPLAAQDTVHRGMGALPYAEGTAFRLWAPHARQVFVKGDFNDWSDTANALEQEGNGYWYADVPGARPPEGWHAQKRSTLAACLVFTAPGIPMLFQGQEFLQGEWFRDDVPLDWDNNDAYRGIVRLYRDLVALRLNRTGDSRGLCGQFINIFHVNDQDNVLAFQRWDRHGPGDDVVVVLNFGHQAWEHYEIGMPVAGHWRLRFNSDASSYSAAFGNYPSADVMAHGDPRDGLAARGSVAIAPYSALIYCLPAAQSGDTR